RGTHSSHLKKISFPAKIQIFHRQAHNPRSIEEHGPVDEYGSMNIEEYGPVDEKFEFWRENKKFLKCDECVPRGPESLPTKFYLLMFSIYRGIDVKTAEFLFWNTLYIDV